MPHFFRSLQSYWLLRRRDALALRCPSRRVVLVSEGNHSARAAHRTLYSVRRKGPISLTPFPSSVFMFLRLCRSSDTPPPPTHTRDRGSSSLSSSCVPHSFMDAQPRPGQYEVGEAGAVKIEGTRERELRRYGIEYADVGLGPRSTSAATRHRSSFSFTERIGESL